MRKQVKDYVETFVYHSAIRALMKKEGFEFHNQFIDDEDKRKYQDSYDKLYYGYQKSSTMGAIGYILQLI